MSLLQLQLMNQESLNLKQNTFLPHLETKQKNFYQNNCKLVIMLLCNGIMISRDMELERDSYLDGRMNINCCRSRVRFAYLFYCSLLEVS